MTILAFGACWGGAPEDLGVQNGTLRPCPATPNCVHTGLRHPDGTRGLFAIRALPRKELHGRIREVIESMPRTTVVSETEIYLHAEVRSRVFRFVDDLEVLIMPDQELVVRSASRVGRSDMGVNSERVEELRRRLEAAEILR